MKYFWVSWTHEFGDDEEEDYRPMTYPPEVVGEGTIIGWWCSGMGGDYANLVAHVSAPSREAAEAAIANDKAWPEQKGKGWRFFEERDELKRPGDRFPYSSWMEERFNKAMAERP